MPSINPEQLENEADELLKTMANPPETPDTDEPVQVLKPEDETPIPKKVEESAKANEPGDDTNELPPIEESGEEGLSLDNARERIRNAQARMHRATQEAADLRKKVASTDGELSAMRSKIAGLERELEALRKQPPAKPESESVEIIADADLNGIAEEYPTFSKPFLSVINKLNNQLKTVTDKLAHVEGKVTKTVTSIEEREESARTQTHFDAIRAAHPDAFTLYETDDFQGWIDRQPPMLRDMVEQGTATDVIYVFDTYKAAVGKAKDMSPAKDRIALARAASTPNVRKVPTNTNKPDKPTFSRSEIAKMTPKQFEKNEAAIDEAIAEGRIVA